jgi:hypothetical protein
MLVMCLLILGHHLYIHHGPCPGWCWHSWIPQVWLSAEYIYIGTLLQMSLALSPSSDVSVLTILLDGMNYLTFYSGIESSSCDIRIIRYATYGAWDELCNPRHPRATAATKYVCCTSYYSLRSIIRVTDLSRYTDAFECVDTSKSFFERSIHANPDKSETLIMDRRLYLLGNRYEP